MKEWSDFQGISYYRSKEDPSTFFYMPQKPTAETDPKGKPTLSLWISDQGAILQLGTKWEAEDALLGELKKHHAERFQLEPALIRLSPVRVSVEGVTLALGDGEGRYQEVKTVSSSGYPPFSAIFNVQLNAEEKSRVAAALNGRRQFLTVTYRGLAPLEVSAETTIEGDAKADFAKLGKDATLTDCEMRIEIALAEGRLILRQAATPEAPVELRQKADRLAKEKAAAGLLRMVRESAGNLKPQLNLDESTLRATASLNTTLSIPIERSTDVSSWFPSGSGTDHIQIVGTTVGHPRDPSQSGETVVRLGFEAKDAPIAFIQVTRGGAQATLRGPGFDSVTLSGNGSENPLVIKTSYKDGGPPFQVTRAAAGPEGWVLTPKDLGIVKVLLDASERRKAGSKNVQARVHYKPSGQGTEHEQMINLRYGDWTESWYIITRSPDLGGLLEFEWKETTADGSVVKHAPATTDSPELKL